MSHSWLMLALLPELPKVSVDPQAADAHQQAPESEAPVLVGDRVFAVEAALVLSHGLHSDVPLRVPAQRLHFSVAARIQIPAFVFCPSKKLELS